METQTKEWHPDPTTLALLGEGDMPTAVLDELGAELLVIERHNRRVTFWMGGCRTDDVGVLGRTRSQVRRQLSSHVEEAHEDRVKSYDEKRRWH